MSGERRAELEIAALALACGAAECGGPLSPKESALVRLALGIRCADARATVARMRDGEDSFGNALANVRSVTERRQWGAFYTAASIVEPMVEWVLSKEPQRIVDPGCGSGRFSVAAAKRDPGIAIVAIDLDPLATLATRAALRAAGARRVRVMQADYLSVDLGRIRGRSAFVGNPPYVRHHALGPIVKIQAARLAAMMGRKVSGLAGLHALFYLATSALHAKRDDVGAFVTSAEWLDVGYGAIVRSLLADELGARSLTVYDPRSIPFEDAMTSAAVATFQVGEPVERIRFRSMWSARGVLDLEAAGTDIAAAALRATRWSPFLRDEWQAPSNATIGTLFRVSRGQVTGANAFFVMSRAVARERGIERFCAPVVAGAQEVLTGGAVLRDGPQRMLALEIPKDLDLCTHDGLADYVRAGEAAGVHLRYVPSRRRPWYALTYPRAPIIATYMARRPPQFSRNPDGLGLLNTVHGLYPRMPLGAGALDRVVAKLNAAREHFVGRGRTYHGGLEKFEPHEMENLPFDVRTSQ